MTQLLLSNQFLSASDLPLECTQVHGTNGQVNNLSQFRPYLLGQPTDHDYRILNTFNSAPPKSLQQLTKLSEQHSPETTIALAEMMGGLKDLSLGSVGAGTSIYYDRVNAFGKAVLSYQEALIRYANASKSGAAPRIKNGLKQNANSAFRILQREFSLELQAVTEKVRSRRGTPLTNPVRGLNIAESSKRLTKLQLTSQIQAHSLVRYSTYANVLGTGLVALDFTTRIGNITTEYQADGNWERELFIESSSFAVSTTAGIAAAKAGGAALALVLTLTPVGWVGLLVGGAAVTLAAGGTAVYVNNLVKSQSGSIYDQIMSWISG